MIPDKDDFQARFQAQWAEQRERLIRDRTKATIERLFVKYGKEDGYRRLLLVLNPDIGERLARWYASLLVMRNPNAGVKAEMSAAAKHREWLKEALKANGYGRFWNLTLPGSNAMLSYIKQEGWKCTPVELTFTKMGHWTHRWEGPETYDIRVPVTKETSPVYVWDCKGQAPEGPGRLGAHRPMTHRVLHRDWQDPERLGLESSKEPLEILDKEAPM